MNPWSGDQNGYDNWINDLLRNAPDSWDSDEGAEGIITAYLHELERRIMSSGGTLERHPESDDDGDDDETPADPETFDGGFGNGSYYQHSMNKD